MFLLDTDHFGLLQRDSDPASSRLRLRMKRYLDQKFYLPIVSFHEQFIGWHGYINRATESAGVVHGYLMFHRVLSDFAKAQVVSRLTMLPEAAPPQSGGCAHVIVSGWKA